MAVARREGFATERESCGNADTLIMWSQRGIRVRSGLPADHEARGDLAPARPHHDPPPPARSCATAAGCDGIIKVEAGSAACIVCARYAIPAPRCVPGCPKLGGRRRPRRSRADDPRHRSPDHHCRIPALRPPREHGTIAGFIGRARPGAGPANPKYLNSPQTATYTKGDILLGLYQSCGLLARGATPVLAEGPFDAIAITRCAPGRYAGLAACGTALTGSQLAVLSRVCDLQNAGVIVAADGDEAGRRAAARAYHVIRAFSTRSAWVSFPAGQDPAAIFQPAGPDALAAILRDCAQPLAQLVVQDEIDRFLSTRESPHQALTAMRAAASLIAGLLPAPAAQAIMTVTAGRELRSWAEDLRPVADPAVEKIARLLAADAACQVAAAAGRLDFDYSDVITEVANAVARQAGSPKRLAGRDRRHDLARDPIQAGAESRNLAAGNFPHGRAWMAADRPQDAPAVRDIRATSSRGLVSAPVARRPGRSR